MHHGAAWRRQRRRVPRVRERIGAEIHRRITVCRTAPTPTRALLSALEMTFFGALVKRAAAPSPTTRSPTGSATWSASSWERTRDRNGTTATRPLRLRLPRGSVPVLPSACATRRRCTATTSWSSGRCPGTPTSCRGSATARRCRTSTASRSTRCSRNDDAHRMMSFLALDDPGHLRLRTLVSKGFTPQANSRARGRGSSRSPGSISTSRSAVGRRSTSSTTSPASSRWTSSPS